MPREDQWWHFRLLLHQIGNHLEERVNQFQQRPSAQVSTACFQEIIDRVDGCDLKTSQRGRGVFPG